MLPPDGSIAHQKNPEVDTAVQAGEAAFAKNDYDEAIKQYSRAFEIEPNNYYAALFIGDAYFEKKEISHASQWYERAIQVNPDIETAYRYECDMLTKNGDFAKARVLAIQAVIAEPYNQVSWRGLIQWAAASHVRLVGVHINTGNSVAEGKGNQTTITLDPSSNSPAQMVWLAYAGERVLWQKEKFKQNYPNEPAYRHSLAEEADALSVAASLLSTRKPEEIASDPNLSLLKKISDAHLIEPYVLLGAADQGIAQDYAPYRKENRPHLAEYLSRFVVPEVPASPEAPKNANPN